MSTNLEGIEVQNIKVSTSLYIREHNDTSLSSNDETAASGLFLCPSGNVPGRPSDITDYVVSAFNELGKLTYSAIGDTLDLSDLSDVTITNPVNDQILEYDSGFWVNSSDTTIAVGGSNTEVQYNNGGTADGISGITTNGTTQLNFSDNSLARFGTGADLTITHNGTNSLITSSTGNLIIENDNATGSIIHRLGTATNATDFQIQDNTNITVFSVDGVGKSLIDGTNSTEKFVIENENNDEVLTVDTTNGNVITNSLTTAAIDVDMVIYSEQQPSGTPGGDFTAGAWQTRPLNTTDYSKQTTAWASFASNQITLQAGTYYIEALAQAFAVLSHIASFYNVTDDVIEILGTSANSSSSNFIDNSLVKGTVIVPSVKIYELRHQCEQTKNGNGLGVQHFFQTNEYAKILILKIA